MFGIFHLKLTPINHLNVSALNLRQIIRLNDHRDTSIKTQTKKSSHQSSQLISIMLYYYFSSRWQTSNDCSPFGSNTKPDSALKMNEKLKLEVVMPKKKTAQFRLEPLFRDTDNHVTPLPSPAFDSEGQKCSFFGHPLFFFNLAWRPACPFTVCQQEKESNGGVELADMSKDRTGQGSNDNDTG